MLTDTPSAAPTRPHSTHRLDPVSPPHPFLQSIHSQTPTHSQRHSVLQTSPCWPHTQCCPQSLSPADEAKGLTSPSTLGYLLPAPWTHVHAHTHESHANSSSRPLPPAALAPARNGQLAVCLSAPSVCPLEKTQSYLHAVCSQVPAPSGTHRLGFLPFSPFGERTFRTASLVHRSWSPKTGQSFPARPWPGPDTALMDESH